MPPSSSLCSSCSYCRRRNRRRIERSREQGVLSGMSLLLLFVSSLTAASVTSGFVVDHAARTTRSMLSQEAAVTALHGSSNTQQQQRSLDALTVKELRVLVKDASSNQRGVLSRLKRKQDLVDYLKNVQDDSRPTDEEKPPSLSAAVAAEASSPINAASTKKNGRKKQLRMPPPKSKKDIAFDRVYERYPPMRDMPEVEEGSDIRQEYHPVLQQYHNRSSDMDLVFVGTASCTPGTTRGVSCTALRLNWKRRAFEWNPNNNGKLLSNKQDNQFQGGTWLFDVGECTQLQIQRTTNVKPSKITKIFVTHAHGDHSFGLPGLLCLMGQDRDRVNAPPVEIYGPEGLRMWLRVAIRYSVSRIVPPYRVHEICDVPMAPAWEWSARTRRYFYKGTGKKWANKGLAGEDSTNWISQANLINLPPSTLYGEIEEGRNIYPSRNHPMSVDGAPVWEIEDEGDVKVFAAPMSHGIPCLGYVVEELPRPGRLRNEYVEPIVRRNVRALKEAGYSIPMKAMAVIKNLPENSAFSFPDGTVVKQEDAVEPPQPGRKVVICGDTCDSRALGKLARNANVVVHESTNAYLEGIDGKDVNLHDVTRDAIIHGHSTPGVAANFCRSIGGKLLVMNHFSARYKGDCEVDSLSIMMRIEEQAMALAGLNNTQVVAAWDMMVLPVPRS